MQEFNIGDKVLVGMKISGKYIIDGPRYKVDTDDGVCGASTWMDSKNIYPADIAARAREDGMAEAWEMARRIIAKTDNGGLAGVELEQIFGMRYGDGGVEVFDDFTASEAAEKIKAWEDSREICVGDVVMIIKCTFGVVTKVKEEGCYVIFSDGSSGKFEKSKINKTGRTIDIAGLLAEIGGAE